MKILYITNGIDGAGGLERVLSVKASYFAEKYGYEVSILVLNGAYHNPFYQFSSKINFYSVEVGGNPIHYLKAYKSGIQNVVNQISPDIISVCDDGLKGFLIPKIIRTKAKIIYERHVSKLIEAADNGTFIKKSFRLCKWGMMEKLGASFSKFIVLTETNKKDWKSLKNIEVIPNPLPFFPAQTSTLENKTVICVGKISYQKGQDLLLLAWEKLADKYPDWSLKMYGKENNSVLDSSKLPKNMFWYPPEKDIEQKYLESSVYVMCSRFEGFGMVLIEAMACGVPCVSFDCDYGPSDIIQNEIDGFLVEKENVQQLAEKLSILIEDVDKRIDFGKRAKENAKRYSVEIIAEKWDDLFKTLLS